jgi:hypothetical protein
MAGVPQCTFAANLAIAVPSRFQEYMHARVDFSGPHCRPGEDGQAAWTLSHLLSLHTASTSSSLLHPVVQELRA